MRLSEVYIVSAVRTPIGAFNGSLSTLKASSLGSIVVKEVLKRANVEGKDVSEVIFGQALTAGQGQNPARQSIIEAGLPYETPAYLVNMLCGSGLKSVVLGYQSIRCNDSKIVICGGQESMSLAPHVIHLRKGNPHGHTKIIDSMLYDGLTDAMYDIHMGLTAENLAKKYSISREEQDEYAVKSQQLAKKAIGNKIFEEEIIAIEVIQRKGNVLVDKDEHPRSDTSIESLKKLKPCFIEDGTVTPGNSSGINDSASAVLIMSGEEVQRRSVKPLAKIVAWAQVGVDPTIMGIGPVGAVEAVLTKANWHKDEVDLYELNEAFAAQTLCVNKCLNINPEKVNIFGGAIALGHPIGASGNRILVTLAYGLKRIGGKRGIAALCIGGGMGIAMAIERC